MMGETMKELLESKMKGVSLRLPEKFHNKLKAKAALEGMSKDDYFKELLVLGYQERLKKSKN